MINDIRRVKDALAFFYHSAIVYTPMSRQGLEDWKKHTTTVEEFGCAPVSGQGGPT